MEEQLVSNFVSLRYDSAGALTHKADPLPTNALRRVILVVAGNIVR